MVPLDLDRRAGGRAAGGGPAASPDLLRSRGRERERCWRPADRGIRKRGSGTRGGEATDQWIRDSGHPRTGVEAGRTEGSYSSGDPV